MEIVSISLSLAFRDSLTNNCLPDLFRRSSKLIFVSGIFRNEEFADVTNLAGSPKIFKKTPITD